MEESTTYQAIIRKGRLSEARKFLLLIAGEKLGPPSPTAQAAINALDDENQLEQLGRRLIQVDSWEALLATPSRRRGHRRNTST